MFQACTMMASKPMALSSLRTRGSSCDRQTGKRWRSGNNLVRTSGQCWGTSNHGSTLVYLLTSQLGMREFQGRKSSTSQKQNNNGMKNWNRFSRLSFAVAQHSPHRAIGSMEGGSRRGRESSLLLPAASIHINNDGHYTRDPHRRVQSNIRLMTIAAPLVRRNHCNE